MEGSAQKDGVLRRVDFVQWQRVHAIRRIEDTVPRVNDQQAIKFQIVERRMHGASGSRSIFPFELDPNLAAILEH